MFSAELKMTLVSKVLVWLILRQSATEAEWTGGQTDCLTGEQPADAAAVALRQRRCCAAAEGTPPGGLAGPTDFHEGAEEPGAQHLDQ